MALDHFYRTLDPTLPDIGWTGSSPRRATPEAAAAIHACTDAAALGAMLGAARSFWGSAGAIPMTAFGGAATAAMGWTLASAIILALGIPATLAWIETRRRARQWEGLIEARLAVLSAAN